MLFRSELGGGAVALDDLAAKLRDRLAAAKSIEGMSRTPDAQRLWNREYVALSDGVDQPSVAAVTDRGTAQVLRLSMIYALLDGQAAIDEQHLRAALAVWRYAADSASRIFGNGTTEPPLVAQIRRHLRSAGEAGATRTQISTALQRNRTKTEIDDALTLLRDTQQARCKHHPTAGRPSERWFIIPSAAYEKNELNEKSPPAEPSDDLNSFHSFLSSPAGSNAAREEIIL